MNLKEKNKLNQKVKDILNHISLLVSDIEEHSKSIPETLNHIKKVYAHEGQEKALRLIPVLRKKIYNNQIKALDLESLHSYLTGIFEISKSFGIELDLESEEDMKKVIYIAEENRLNTYVEKDKLFIHVDSSLDFIVEKTGTDNLIDDKVVLNDIINQPNVKPQ